MQTVLIVHMQGHTPLEIEEAFRKKIMKELEEGLIIVDDRFDITVHNIQGEIGLEFNKE